MLIKTNASHNDVQNSKIPVSLIPFISVRLFLYTTPGGDYVVRSLTNCLALQSLFHSRDLDFFISSQVEPIVLVKLQYFFMPLHPFLLLVES